MLFSSPRAETWSRAQGWLRPHRQLTSCRPCAHRGLHMGATQNHPGAAQSPLLGSTHSVGALGGAFFCSSGRDALEHGECEDHRAGRTPSRIPSQPAFLSSLGPGRFPEGLCDTAGCSMQPALHGRLASPAFPPPGAGSLPSLPSALVGIEVQATIPPLPGDVVVRSLGAFQSHGSGLRPTWAFTCGNSMR